MSSSPHIFVLTIGAPPDARADVAAALAPEYVIRHAPDTRTAIAEIAGGPGADLILLWASADTPLADCEVLANDTASAAIPVLALLEYGADERAAFALGAADCVARPAIARILRARVDAQLALQALRAQHSDGRGDTDRDLLGTRDGLRTLVTQMARDEWRERRRLAGILHDGPAQDLAAACMYLSAARSTDDGADEALMRDATELIHATLAQLRTLMLEISPPNIHEHNLPAALDWLADRFKAHANQDCTIEVDEPLRTLGEEATAIVFHVAREILVRAAERKGVGSLRLHFGGSAEHLTLRFRERGTAPDAQPPPTMEIGNQIALLGGSMSLESDDDASVRIELPLP